jgi:hypothetical protein
MSSRTVIVLSYPSVVSYGALEHALRSFESEPAQPFRAGLVPGVCAKRWTKEQAVPSTEPAFLGRAARRRSESQVATIQKPCKSLLLTEGIR